MKKFLQFITESRKPKVEYIFNSHGAHASLPLKSNVKNPYYKRKRFSLIENAEDTPSLIARKRLPSEIEASKKPASNAPEGGHGDFDTQFLDTKKHGTVESRKKYQDDMQNKIDELHKNHSHSEEGKTFLNEFTSGSKHLTEALLNHHVLGHNIVPRYKGLVEGLDQHGFLPAKNKLETYSGVGFNINNVEPVGKSKEGNPVYHQPTYMSSSIDKGVAHDFADDAKNDSGSHIAHIFHWHHDKNEPIGVIGNHSDYPKEKEVLVPRTESTPHRYHIEHLGTDKYLDQGNREYHVHRVKRIPESKIIKEDK